MKKFSLFIIEQNSKYDTLEFEMSIDEDYIYYKLYFGRDIYASCNVEILINPYLEVSHIYSQSKFNKKFNNSKICKIDDFKTDTELQGEGIGTHFMNLVLRDLKKKNIDFIYLNACPIGNYSNKIPLEKLVSFYKKFNFIEIKRESRNAEMILKL